VRFVFGAISEFEKASLVAKLKVARDRRIAAGEKCGGRRSHVERWPEVVALAKKLRASQELAARDFRRARRARPSERHGKPFAAMSVRKMVTS
jgi:hypothetical protein